MATADILGIWNDAVGNIGVKTSIASLTEQSAEAAACALRYQRVVEGVLRGTDWNCLRLTTALEDITDDFAPPARWARRYEFPDNCLAFRRLENPVGVLWTWLPDPSPVSGFEIAMDLDPDASDRPTKYVYSNWTELSAIYTSYVYNSSQGYYEALFDPGLKEALGWALAAAIAGPLTGNAQIMATARSEAMRKLGEAQQVNGNESAPNSMDASPAESLTIRGLNTADWPPMLVNWR